MRAMFVLLGVLVALAAPAAVHALDSDYSIIVSVANQTNNNGVAE